MAMLTLSEIAIIDQQVKETIDAWKTEFKEDLLDPSNTDWLDEAIIEGIEETEEVRKVFNQKVLAAIGVPNAFEDCYSYD